VRGFVLILAPIFFLASGLIAQQKPEPVEPGKPQGTPNTPQVKPEEQGKPGDQKTDPKPDAKTDPKTDSRTDSKTDLKTNQDSPAKPPSDGDFPRRKEAFRFRILGGVGYEKIHPMILSEAGPAWQLNSFIRSTDGVSQPAVLIQDTGKIPAVRLKLSGDVAYKDRLFFDYERQWTSEKYSNKYPTRVTFYAPGNSTYENAIYEGLRLLQYKEVTNNYSLTYLHPIGKGVKLGAFVEREEYHENIEISMGSLSLVRATDLLTWSQAGSIPGGYGASGNTFGFAARYQMFEWLSFSYRMNPIRRVGSYNLGGPQILNSQTGSVGLTDLALLLPVAFGDFSDKGTRHRLETSFRLFCRYYAILGVLKEDYNRSYSIYFGNTFSSATNYTPKTSGLGIGEMSQAHKATKLEVYLKFGGAFFL